QTRGAFSKEFNTLRDRLIELASLLELELDFSEEDVEFADRTHLMDITRQLLRKINRLTASYSAGRAFKEGIPVVIAGLPNVGKSTLLNALLQEDKAIVSNIPGTTRDIIEDTCEIEGILFRFVDTAGLHESSDMVESIGIERARRRMEQAAIIAWLIDPTAPAEPQLNELSELLPKLTEHQKLIAVITKGATQPQSSALNAIDQKLAELPAREKICDLVRISAAEDEGLDKLRTALRQAATSDYNPDNEILLTNARHYSDLLTAGKALTRALEGMESRTSADFIAMDIREATTALSSLTGAITPPDLLNSIFSQFCIGK
ncbi:MAG: 50S ribosome-binding GTPase, partial [Muribaculaceae bacterium]|nr:50S ribosome-binding GTPase [Muribaculaceae bacterium]